MACGATLKRRHDCITEAPELPLKRRRFVPSQEVMAPSSPSSSPPPARSSSSSIFPSLISHMTPGNTSASKTGFVFILLIKSRPCNLLHTTVDSCVILDCKYCVLPYDIEQ